MKARAFEIFFLKIQTLERRSGQGEVYGQDEGPRVNLLFENSDV